MNTSDYLIEGLVSFCLVILVASAIYLLSQKYKTIPFPVMLFLAGLLSSLLGLHFFGAIKLSPEVVLYVFLPLLLFESAFNFDFREFRRILVPGFILSSVGLVISALVIAVILQVILQIDFLQALLFGAVISSTDPIAVLSIFKQIGVPQRLLLLVDGESFLNDATSVIGYRLILGVVTAIIAAGGQSATFGATEILAGLLNFIYVFAGGFLIGALLGFIFAEIVSLIKNVKLVEISLTVVLAILAFVVTDHFLKMSGIIAALGAGLVMGNYGRTKISPKIVHNIHEQWEFLIFIITALIFFLIGYEINLAEFGGNLGMVAVSVMALLLGRLASVYLLMPIYNLFAKKANKIPAKWMIILNLGGLRGILPLVVILSMPDTIIYKSLFIQFVIGAIIFTLLVNALAIKPIINRLGLAKLAIGEEIEAIITELLVLQRLKAYVLRLHEIQEITDETLKVHMKKIETNLNKLKETIKLWIANKDSNHYNLEMEKVVKKYSLQIEKSIYRELYKNEIIDEPVYNKLLSSVHRQIELIDEGHDQFKLQSLTHEEQSKRIKNSISSLGSLWSKLGTKGNEKAIKSTYLYYKARFLGNEMVLEELGHFEAINLEIWGDELLSKVRSKYLELLEQNKQLMKEMSVEYSEITANLEEQIYQCECNQFIEKMLGDLTENGKVSSKSLQDIHFDI